MSDLISRQAAIEVIDSFNVFESRSDQIKLELMIGELPIAGVSTNLAEVGTDLISRAAAQTELQLSARRYTVAHEAHGEGRVVWSEDLISVSDAMNVLRKLPSAQPEIIHCGECTKMKVDSVFHDCWCSETGKKVWIDHYCGYAERREETT